ncbi:MAG: DUF4040 domain-containing protein [Caenispirillum bisanense]|nr:DUF4040 domain-containing protein [Caenispirillum bisanense]MCA1971779.1 DUF4040 domain-containing protein [Caenispirillum sp.]
MIDIDMVEIVDVALLSFLVVAAIIMVRMHNLFGVVMTSGIYSLLSAAIFTTLDAVDVAFTEAAVGAGISTVLMLGTLAITGRYQKPARRSNALGAFAVVLVTGGALIWGTYDMPAFGDPTSPIQVSRVTERYIELSGEEIGIPNIVTSVLASYRGYDTLGETAVVFTAAVGVLLLLGRSRRQRRVVTEPRKREAEES